MTWMCVCVIREGWDELVSKGGAAGVPIGPFLIVNGPMGELGMIQGGVANPLWEERERREMHEGEMERGVWLIWVRRIVGERVRGRMSWQGVQGILSRIVKAEKFPKDVELTAFCLQRNRQLCTRREFSYATKKIVVARFNMNSCRLV